MCATSMGFFPNINYDLYIVADCPQGCHNGGACTSPFTCTCLKGWSGLDCKIGLCIIDTCIILVCMKSSNYVHIHM